MSSFVPDKMFNATETNQQVADATKALSEVIEQVLKANKVTVRFNYETCINCRTITCDGIGVDISRYSDEASHIWVDLKDGRRKNKCNKVIKQLRIMGFWVGLMNNSPIGKEYF